MDFPVFNASNHPTSSPDREWRASDERYAARLPGGLYDALIEVCAASGRVETGGVLAGRYSADGGEALIDAFSTPPPDSKRGPFGFLRGQRGLDRWLRELWGEGRYYLGEWHLHPSGAAEPSGTDRGSLRAIADDGAYQCPNPLMLIVGGAAPRWRCGLWVCARGRPVMLQEVVRVEGG